MDITGGNFQNLPTLQKQRNLDSILKIRDITLPTKVHVLKATVFPEVMYMQM